MKINLYSSFYFLLAALLMLSGCEKEYEGIEEVDAREVQAYIQRNNLDVQQYNNTGIYYKVITEGNGDSLEYTDRIFATFTAKSLDGSFDMQADSINRFSSFLGYFAASKGYPQAFATIIKEKVTRGSTVRIIIPSHQAYGRGGHSTLDIPGNASLDCIVTVYDVNNQTEFEDIFVKRYIDANYSSTTLSRTPKGLYYHIITEGTGTEVVTPASDITVSYVGKLTNGTIFDQSTSYTSALNLLIPGWQEGIPKIRKGGKIRLIVPPSLGYGSSPTGSIPAYSTLDFVVELLDVK